MDISLLATLAFLITFNGGDVIAARNDKRLNVLFLVSDDLRPALGCYGDTIAKTSNIDNLASKSVIFDKAYVQQALCGPSRVSFMTSRRPDTTHLYNFHLYWRTHVGNYTSMPQYFKEHGYITQSAGKVFGIGGDTNHTDDYPISWTNPAYHAPTEAFKMAKVCPNPDGSLGMNAICPVDVDKMPGKSLPDIQSADFAINFLKNMSIHGKGQPFFLGVGFHKPHIPLKYPKEYLDLYPLSEIHLAKHHTYPMRMPLVAWNPWADIRLRDDVKKLNISFPFGPMPLHFQRLMRQSYYAATSFMDTQLGRVLSALEDAGFADNTIISLIGDHGWSLGEHQEWSKYSLFDEATRVPLVMHIPGVTYTRKRNNERIFPFYDLFKQREAAQSTEGKESSREFIKSKKNNFPINHSSNYLRTSALSELVDLFPTLSEAAGLPTLSYCPVPSLSTILCTEGMSLMPLIRNLTSRQNYTDEYKNENNNNNNKSISSTSHLDKVVYEMAKKCSQNFSIPVLDSYRGKKAVFSQFPRPSVEPQWNSDQPHLPDIRIMGYSMRTDILRYTEWVQFSNTAFQMNWDTVYGRELYLTTSDPYEIHNMALYGRCRDLVKTLSHQLHLGWKHALPDAI